MATKKRLSSSPKKKGKPKSAAKKAVNRKSSPPLRKKAGTKSTSTNVAKPRTQKTGSPSVSTESRDQKPESVSPNLENSVVMTIIRGAGTAVGRAMRLADKAAIAVRAAARKASRRKDPN